MGIVELVLIAVGLAMDAFAVAVGKGLTMRTLDYRRAAMVAVFFGGFQALMPGLGWLLGIEFASYIVGVDHWIAFALLALVGGTMARDGIRGDDDRPSEDFSLRELLILAVATSIDALAAGIGFAFLGLDIRSAVICIGVITFILSFIGVLVGHRVGGRFQKNAKITGGVILILMGLKILGDHLGLFGG